LNPEKMFKDALTQAKNGGKLKDLKESLRSPAPTISSNFYF